MINYIKQELEKDYVKVILNKVDKLRKTTNIFPEKSDVFNALTKTNFDDLKLIIIGQDPYPTKGVADGFAFSSKTILPKSLNNIFTEIKKDFPDFNHETNSLENWAKQGVLLLNTTLTVEEGKPLSHKNFGWDKLTHKIFELVTQNHDNLMICLWGNKAQKFASNIDLSRHVIFRNSHPSPLGYYRNFKDCGIFKKINKTLEKMLKKPINWNL
ncbi:uracil-DNA glycosylase [Mycoplasmopsis californica]|uniref:Uracil-DNA glycosylase n=1 Tax=Mycoplasmopsis equigenitalium TaxID=114883 RepID=A0ABY5J0F0_9BACT|nr:uracil-DNA glycosylase [Mycoplasmopsis equigenitalium]UUD36740.1 uracil-DNA glycosylase [Mycoplasmopsis equigenitalium]VEU69966.1 uracil-DNA glycosylase [Mycoplasmopsis californica]